MVLAIVLVPAMAGLSAFVIRQDAPRRMLLLSAAVIHAALTAATWFRSPDAMFSGWLLLDAPGRLFLSIASAVFLVAAVYAQGYLARVRKGVSRSAGGVTAFDTEPEAVFTACLLLFVASMSLSMVTGHFGLFWVAIEASTLASAPLIYYHRSARSLEATWKYLVVCSVGVALALLGNYLLAVSARADGAQIPVLTGTLVENGPRLQPQWLKAAFLFLLVGYGTKMGLAPLHNWLPDAHSESPSFVSCLLSGALLNCAFLGILRGLQVLDAAGLGDFGRRLMLGFGIFSIALAAVFILGQADYKRMLAYSSVEHMGILALGIGLGGAATFGAMLHAVNHSLTKAMLFLAAGNILSVYHTKSTRGVKGLVRGLPASGCLWLAGFLAITGSPPFGLFISEFTIFRAAVDQGHPAIAAAYLGLLALVFIGMAGVVLRMAQGEPGGDAPRTATRESWISVLPPMVLGFVVLLLGVYIPGPLEALLKDAARVLGGN